MTDPAKITDRRPSAPAMSEADLQTAVIELAQLRGWLVHHCRPGQTAGGRWATQLQGDAGFPDLVAVRDRTDRDGDVQLLFIELKSGKGKPSAKQWNWLCALASVGDRCPRNVEALLWTPEHWISGEIERRLA